MDAHGIAAFFGEAGRRYRRPYLPPTYGIGPARGSNSRRPDECFPAMLGRSRRDPFRQSSGLLSDLLDVRPGESARVMATILFTDMVGSTEEACKARDAAWQRTLALHDDVVRTVLVRFGGREVETAGEAAIRVPIRVGIHSGEVAPTAERVRGVAVHVAARILDEARPGECSCRAPPAILPRDLPGSHSSRGGGTASRAWSGSTTCLPRHHPDRPVNDASPTVTTARTNSHPSVHGLIRGHRSGGPAAAGCRSKRGQGRSRTTGEGKDPPLLRRQLSS